MKHHALLLLVLLGIALGYGIACSLSAHVARQAGDALCDPFTLRGTGVASLFLLIATGFLTVSLSAVLPTGLIFGLYRPPHQHA